MIIRSEHYVSKETIQSVIDWIKEKIEFEARQKVKLTYKEKEYLEGQLNAYEEVKEKLETILRI